MISNSSEQTFEFGKKYAASLKPGDVVLLEGDLGTGKTQFVKGICSYFNVKENVNSPTFILVNEYSCENIFGVKKIFHFDLYRIKRSEELQTIGFQEYLKRDAICLIEWPQLVVASLADSTRKVKFSHGEEVEERVIEGV